MSIRSLLNLMTLQAESIEPPETTRVGIVSGYDANKYAAKVMYQPENIESGWLPILVPWVGNQWGMYCPPTLGDTVAIIFQEGQVEAGILCSTFYDNLNNIPLTVNSGEFWLVHKSGSFFKLTNDGNVTINANSSLNITINALNAGAVNITGNLNVTGNIVATGNITDSKDSMENIRTIYNSHTHAGGPIPDQQMPV